MSQTIHEILTPSEVADALTAAALRKRGVTYDPPTGAASVAVRIVKGEAMAAVHIREVPGQDDGRQEA